MRRPLSLVLNLIMKSTVSEPFVSLLLPVLAFGIALNTFVAKPAGAAVWLSQSEWTATDEEKFNHWVKENWSRHFFAQPNTVYTGLEVDCADTVYSLRVIYAAQAGLPFAIQDPTGGKTRITNAMTRWDHLPAEIRVRSFLQYLYGIVSTRSLPNDTYPVAVNRQAIVPGGLILADELSHHSYTIQDISESGIPHLVFSSRPAKTSLLEMFGFPSFGFLFQGGLKPERGAGFRYWRKSSELGIPSFKVTGYSEEQYTLPQGTAWAKTMQARLALVDEIIEDKLNRLLTASCREAKERVAIVQEGVQYLERMKERKCMNAQEFDDYSTPNRDARLKNTLRETEEAIAEWKSTPSILTANLVAMIDGFTQASEKAAQDYCTIETGFDQEGIPATLTLADLNARFKKGLISYNPHDPWTVRWGFTSGRSERARSCPEYH